MIEVKENIGSFQHPDVCAYDNITFICPMCGGDQQLAGGTVSFCLECYADILDISELVDCAIYRMRFHFGIVGYDGEEEKCQ